MGMVRMGMGWECGCMAFLAGPVERNTFKFPGKNILDIKALVRAKQAMRPLQAP